MRHISCAAFFVACLITAPAAAAGDFFVNGQYGRMDLDDSAFDDGKRNLLQAGAGYRWGVGIAQVGIEAGLGKLGEQDDRTSGNPADGIADRAYTLSSRYGFVGASARIKPPLLPVYFTGRAGYLGMEHELDETTFDPYLDTSQITGRSQFKQTDGGTYAGVGVGTTVLPLLDVGLMYNHYRYAQVEYDPLGDEYHLSDDKQDARSVSLSVEYRF